MERQRENGAFVAFEGSHALAIGAVVHANFRTGAADRQELAVSAVRHGVYRAGQALELLAQVDIIVRGGAALVIRNTVGAGHAQFAAVGDDIFLGMARDAHDGIEQLVDVVNELPIGSIDQFHGAVARAGDQALAIRGPDRAENPIAVVVELEQFLASATLITRTVLSAQPTATRSAFNDHEIP